MTVLRVRKKTTNFLILDKTCLTQSNISWGAKGLHSYLMGLPSEWRVNVHDLKNRATNGRDSVRGLLNELERAGYIVKEQIRDEVTGKFSCLEYVIHELPENTNFELPDTESPETAFPAPAIPETEKPSLININNNKYTNKKIIKAAAAAEENYSVADDESESEKAAAAFFVKNTQSLPKRPTKVSFINQASPEDSVIGKKLTPYQHERLESLITTVRNEGFCVMPNEIEYCLLSPQHFKGCGQDFGRKLNAIRTVILRGEWQTPAVLFLGEKMKSEMDDLLRKTTLSTAKAEVNHFQRLFESVKGSARESVLEVLITAKKKVKELEEKFSETESGG